jgi:DNA-binding FrmR family transcriptional regulator
MRECMDVGAAVARLKKIEGQVRGIMAMVQSDVPCEDILIQIGASKAALPGKCAWARASWGR